MANAGAYDQILGTLNQANYQWIDNGHGGVNYYANGQPITREQFASGTQLQGSPQYPGAIEAWVAKNYQGTQNQQNQQSGGTSGGSTSSYSPDQIAQVLKVHNANVNNINSAYGAGLLSYEEQQKALDQNRQDMQTQLQNNQNANSAYFSNVSPDAYQSQSGVYNQKILDAYGTAQNNATDQQTLIDQAKAGLTNTQQQALANENATFNATYGPSGAPTVNDQLSPLYNGGTSNAIPTLTPVTMANVGASLSPYSPNGVTGQQGTQTSQQATSPIDQYLNPLPQTQLT